MKIVTGMAGTGKDPDPTQVALALGVRWAVSGSCQRAGDRLRLSFSLIDASTRAEATGGKLDGTIDGLFELEDRLAQAIARALHVNYGAQECRASGDYPRAFELHAKARKILHQAGRDVRVIALLEEAIALAPEYVPALAALASASGTRFIASGDPADLERALVMSKRAVDIDPGNAEAWSWRGYALVRLERVTEALEACRHAVELGGRDHVSRYIYGGLLHSIGRTEEALGHLQRAVTLEPSFGMGWLSLGWTWMCLGRHVEARYALGRAKVLEGQPGTAPVAGVGGYIADCLRCEQRFAEARLEALAGLESIERSDHMYRDTLRALCLGALGRATLLQGDRDAARAAFSQAVAQMRGRSRTLGGGHVFVQALAGLARTVGDPVPFEEALRVFEAREGYSFKFFFGCTDAVTLLELARTAEALGRRGQAQTLLARARAAGSREEFGGPEP